MTQLREQNPNWKGGRSIASSGYVLIRVGQDHHLADVRGYAYEHRIVAEQILGRRLRKGEQPHHINGNKQDNRPENLIVMRSHRIHRVAHRKPTSKLRRPGQPNPRVQCACGCGGKFLRFDNNGFGRPRHYISGHNPPNRAKQTVLIKQAGTGASIRQLAQRTGQSVQAVKCMASKLVQQHKLARLGRGIYGNLYRHPVV